MSDGTVATLKIATFMMLFTFALTALAVAASNSVCSESVEQLGGIVSQSCGPSNTSEIVEISEVSYLHCKCSK